jgi:hypothetical protein
LTIPNFAARASTSWTEIHKLGREKTVEEPPRKLMDESPAPNRKADLEMKEFRKSLGEPITQETVGSSPVARAIGNPTEIG